MEQAMMMALAKAGGYAAVGLAAIGSSIGTGVAGASAIGAWKKCYAQNRPAPFLLLAYVGAPITQTLYGMILMFTTWLSPVLYTLALVRDATSPTLFFLYQLNPITTAVNLFHYAFWLPTTSDQVAFGGMVGDHVLQYGVYGLILSFAFLAVGQFVFRLLEKNFAQDL